MPLQKVKSGRVITISADNFVGDKGTLFFDEDIPVLRLGDGVTPGGIIINTGGGSTSSYVLPVASPSVLGGVKIGANLTITPDGVLSVNSGTAAAFKTIIVNTNTSLVAEGEDTIEFIAGAGISLSGNPTGSPYKSITIASSAFGNIDGGAPDSVYGGVALIDGGGI